MKNLLTLTAIVCTLLAAATSSQAQTIAWGPAHNIVGVTDVANNGTAFAAGSFYSTPLTINGVTFGNFPTTGNSHSLPNLTITNSDNTGAFGPAFSSTAPSSVDYSNLTHAGTFGESSGVDSVTISGLTLGNVYQVQAWSYWTGAGSTTTTYSGTTPVSLGTAVGQYAIGTFTATGTTESFFYSTEPGGHNFLNAISVRDISGASAVPEPSTWALMLGGIGCLAFYVRRRRSL